MHSLTATSTMTIDVLNALHMYRLCNSSLLLEVGCVG